MAAPLGFGDPRLGNVYLMVDFAVLGSSFPSFSYYFITHDNPLLSLSFFSHEKTL